VASDSHAISHLLKEWNAGDEQALEQLTPLVYAELHRAAHRYMAGERSEHTLQTTALVNELYLRLVDIQQIDWQNRAHFFGVCAQLMRRILVDFARERCSQKRGGEIPRLPLDDELVVSCDPQPDLVALDDALKVLSDIDKRKARVVELRFFGGLDVRETAEVLRVSSETVIRDWKMAKAWLFRELSHENSVSRDGS
jgi:RNA polymerase sigma factor (TIGR02999 family)